MSLRDCSDCGAGFVPAPRERTWRKVRCPDCAGLRALRRAQHELGYLLPLSARQARRLRGYLDACGALYARWARCWAFPSLGALEAFREAALTPAGRVSRNAESRLQAAGIVVGTALATRERKALSAEPCPF